MRSLAVLSLVAVLGSLVVVGCSGDDSSGTSTSSTSGGSGDPNCFDYGTFNGESPAVSFATDVIPILQTSCSLSTSCHQSEAGTGGRPYLGTAVGTAPTAEQIQKIFDQNVDVASQAEPGMSIVASGDPANSFMMHKVDGTFSCAVLECGPKKTCGLRMPSTGTELPSPQRDTIRRWIAQGAQNN